MMHPKLRWVMFAAALGLVACQGDPTDSLRNGAHGLRASPGTVYVPQGDSVAIVTELFDEQGNKLTATFSGTSSDPTQLPVTLDNSFIPVYDANNVLVPPTDATRARFFVKGVGLAAGTLTFTSAGLTQTVPVLSFPSAAGGGGGGTNFAVASLSTTTPALGDTVTLTVPAPWKLDPAATVFGANGPLVSLAVAADSSSIQFIPGPNIDTTVTVGPALLTFGPANDPNAPTLSGFNLESSVALTSPVLTTVAVVIGNTAPNTNDLVTVTAPAGFKFLPNAGIRIGNNSVMTVTTVAADSNSFTFRAQGPGSTGNPTLDNVVLDFLTSVPLSLDATTSMTVGATVTSLAGTDAIATAPLQVIPDSGTSSVLSDAGGFPGSSDCGNSPGGAGCRMYKIVLTADQTFRVAATWNNTSDIGIYFMDAAFTDVFPGFGCDAHGPDGAGETCDVPLVAGTYYMAAVDFAPFYPPPDDVSASAITITLTGLGNP